MDVAVVPLLKRRQICENVKVRTIINEEKFHDELDKTMDNRQNDHTISGRKRLTPEISMNITESKRKKDNVEDNGILVESHVLDQIRHRTFSHWTTIQPSKSQMIEAGFFYSNVHDRVLCTYCNLICQQWTAEDEPVFVHKTISPNCYYVKSYLNLNPCSVVTDQTLPTLGNQACALNFGRNQQYSDISKRQSTFSAWPTDQKLPSVHHLVRAGFFYTGIKTIVTCFYCNGSLHDWGPNDQPHIEHARWFPHCVYIKQLCGNRLYQRIQQLKHGESAYSIE
ncbi:unnamed protein product [Didymodactylos carnosus]|uniref:Inhibitor of apoptosis 2 n=1 Tax=Didymodactylos carnosus TaxID=1234261 RepID=A0A8S2F5A2_9BILA|nr:unnamed protein product [Didymodactylos carnosus]CAF4156654.1 unnamed protein product [Didymodactylos carnosus]